MQAGGHPGSGALGHAVFYHAGGMGVGRGMGRKVCNSRLLAVSVRLDAALGHPSCSQALRLQGAPCLVHALHLLVLHALFALCGRAGAQGKHLEVLQSS